MIAAPLPLLWRRADAVAALARIGAKALITCGHVGSFNHCQLAMRVAAEVFSIRYVCGFGEKLPDGVVPFDDLFTAREARSDPAARPRTAAQCRRACRRSSPSMSAKAASCRSRAIISKCSPAASALLLESRLAQDATILSTIAPSSFAGISLTLLPWLLSGGTLVLHHPFDAGYARRSNARDDRCGDAGPARARRAAPRRDRRVCAAAVRLRHRRVALAGTARDEPGLARAGHRPRRRSDLRRSRTRCRAPRRRRPAGAIPFGAVVAPRGSAGAGRGRRIGAHRRQAPWRCAGRWCRTMPSRPGSNAPACPISRSGAADWSIPATPAASIPSPRRWWSPVRPPGIVSVGGYRFPLHELQEVVGRIDSGATLAALPDPLIGQRLIGNAADRDAVQAALNAVGVNPIVAAAFRDRSERDRRGMRRGSESMPRTDWRHRFESCDRVDGPLTALWHGSRRYLELASASCHGAARSVCRRCRQPGAGCRRGVARRGRLPDHRDQLGRRRRPLSPRSSRKRWCWPSPAAMAPARLRWPRRSPTGSRPAAARSRRSSPARARTAPRPCPTRWPSPRTRRPSASRAGSPRRCASARCTARFCAARGRSPRAASCRPNCRQAIRSTTQPCWSPAAAAPIRASRSPSASGSAWSARSASRARRARSTRATSTAW